MALPPEQRLRTVQDFRGTFRSAKGFREGQLLLKAKATKNASSRFGIVVAKSVAKKAVERNRMRRLLTEALKANQHLLPAAHDVLVIALPGLSLKNLNEASENIERALLKASRKTSP